MYTAILKNHMQTNLDPIIGENQSAAIKNRTILRPFSTIRDVIDVSGKLNRILLEYFQISVNLWQSRLGFHALRKFILSQICYSFLLPFFEVLNTIIQSKTKKMVSYPNLWLLC